MKKLKRNLIITLILGIIASIFLIVDYVFLKNISNGTGNFDFEWQFINYSFFIFIVFFISIFNTIYKAFYFLNKKIYKTY
jgi:hypothetical protein